MKLFNWIKKIFKRKMKMKEPDHYQIAFREIGIKEVSGSKHNPRIIEYHKATSLKATHDEVAWCSAFANWVLKEAGIKGTNSAMARSFMNWGSEVKIPFLGCIVVFWREKQNGSKGHVAFYVDQDDKYIYVLGGNQGDQVSIAKYPKAQLLGYRWIIN